MTFSNMYFLMACDYGPYIAKLRHCALLIQSCPIYRRDINRIVISPSLYCFWQCLQNPWAFIHYATTNHIDSVMKHCEWSPGKDLEVRLILIQLITSITIICLSVIGIIEKILCLWSGLGFTLITGLNSTCNYRMVAIKLRVLYTLT